MVLKSIKDYNKKSFLKRLIPGNKRGMGVGDIYPIMLTISLVAILIGVILFVLLKFEKPMSTYGAIVTNETGWINGSDGVRWIAKDSNDSTCGFHDFKVIDAWNVSGPAQQVRVPAANYTVDPDTGIVINATNDKYCCVNFTYSYNYGGVACKSLRDITKSIYEFVSWIGIILLIIAAAIILGILIRNLGGGGSRV